MRACAPVCGSRSQPCFLCTHLIRALAMLQHAGRRVPPPPCFGRACAQRLAPACHPIGSSTSAAKPHSSRPHARPPRPPPAQAFAPWQSAVAVGSQLGLVIFQIGIVAIALMDVWKTRKAEKRGPAQAAPATALLQMGTTTRSSLAVSGLGRLPRRVPASGVAAKVLRAGRPGRPVRAMVAAAGTRQARSGVAAARAPFARAGTVW